jgi:SAM-dependent methyltransferase
MLDYDRESARYDETRGGVPRADAAAEAVASLLPGDVRTVLDVAGGTGLVAARMAARGYDVVVCDRSPGMLRLAAQRRPGHVVTGDATCLPVGSGRVHAVTLVWLLHLLADAAPVLAECSRVLAPGGVLVTTVDKDASYDLAGDDIARVVGTYPPPRNVRDATDSRALLEKLAVPLGFAPCAAARFVGHGQGRSPNGLAQVFESRPSWLDRRVDRARVAELAATLRSLPDPDRLRPPPTYSLVAFRKESTS